MPNQIKVLFNDRSEFETEVRRINPGNMVPPADCLRLTLVCVNRSELPLTDIIVVAGFALFDSQQQFLTLVELELYCGQVMKGEVFDQAAAGKRANGIMEVIRTFAGQEHLGVAAGRFYLNDTKP